MNNKTKNIKQIIGYLIAVGISIFVLLFVVTSSWIGYKVKNQCEIAKQIYGGDCVESLSAQLIDEERDFSTRNLTIWALGEIGDERALAVLEPLYTGFVPPRESWDGDISQYELKKAIKLIKSGFNLTAWAWHSSMNTGSAGMDDAILESIILSDPGDDYYILAQKIADLENLVIVDNITQALTHRPNFILWVVSPENISEKDLWSTGDIFKKMDYYPALGIISGETVEIAEQLWKNGKLTKSGENYLGTDVEVDQQILKPIIVDLNEPDKKAIPLTRSSLIQTLAASDYFYWVRHVSSNKWMWDTTSDDYGEDSKLYSEDIPELGPMVIQTPSCGSFHPWKSDSISIGFINQGAAAYIGHVHTSVFGNSFIMRKGFTIPGVNTWKEFPLGILAQVRNRMEGRASSSTPLYFMLGDPRAYLSDQQPYLITNDVVEGNTRRINGQANEHGYLAVKIEDAADYDFVTITNLTSASENDFFFNNALQTLNLDGNKYLLFYHEGESFEIILKEKMPLMWNIWDGLVDSLDYNWVTIGVVYSPISFVFLVGMVVLLLVKTLRQKKSLRHYRWIFFSSAMITALHLAYLLLRADAYTVSAGLVDYSPLKIIQGAAGIFATTSSGLILVQDAKKRFSVFSGWLVSVLPQTFITVFYLIITAYTNFMFITANTVSAPIWNTRPFWLTFIGLAVELFLTVGFYQLVIRRNKQKQL